MVAEADERDEVNLLLPVFAQKPVLFTGRNPRIPVAEGSTVTSDEARHGSAAVHGRHLILHCIDNGAAGALLGLQRP